MIYKLVMSNTKDTIRLNSDEELQAVISRIQAGDKLIICKQGVVNPSYLVTILEDREAYDSYFHYVRTPEERKKKELELNNEPSSFAKALSGQGFGQIGEAKPNLLN